jgi:hypothetical protein
MHKKEILLLALIAAIFIFPCPSLAQIIQKAPTLQQTPTTKISISSADMGNLVNSFFSGTKFMANSAGNINDYPHRIEFNKSGMAPLVWPLGRMEYNLTDAEKVATTGEYWSGLPGLGLSQGKIRTKTIRSSLEHWVPEVWSGLIENYQIKISLKFKSLQLTATGVAGAFPQTTPLTKTRRIVENNPTAITGVPFADILSYVGWMDTWDWIHPLADTTIKDHHNGQTFLNITLSPSYLNNAITYNLVNITWYSTPVGGAFMSSHTASSPYPDYDFELFNQVPTLKDRILSYNTYSKEVIRNFTTTLFNNTDFKTILSASLTDLARQKLPSGAQIKSVLAGSNYITVVY